MMTTSLKADRRGMGILVVLVTVLLLAVFVTGFAQLTFAGRVQRDGASLVDGERSRFAVQSALDEAVHEFQRQANDPDSALFRKLRHGRPFEGTVPVSISAKLFADQGPLDSREVRFDYQPVVTDDGPYMGGTVSFRASAGSGWMRRDARHGMTTREVRVAPVSPPHPFDEVTLLILAPFPSLVDPGRANADLEEDLRKSKDLQSSRSSIDSLLSQVQAHLDKAGAVGSKFQSSLAAVAERPLPQHPEYTHSVEDRYHFIDASAVVASFEPQIDDLHALGVPATDVERLAAEVERTAKPPSERETQLRNALQEILKLDPTMISEAYESDENTNKEVDQVIQKVVRKVDDYRKASLDHANALLARSMRYTQFTDGLVEYTSDKSREVHAMTERLFDLETAWSERASFRFDSTEALRKFVEQYRKRGEGLRGIAYQAAATNPVDLGTLDLKGRLVLATPATVSAGGKTSDGRGNSLTVVASKFELGGEARAAVICRRFQGTAGGRLHGRLLIQELRSLEDLAGSVTTPHRPDRDQASGQGEAPRGRSHGRRLRQLQVVVSPWAVDGGVARGS